MNRWVGRVAVVTGASSGIGARIVEDLVKNGLVVAGVARREDRLAALSASLEGLSGKFHAVPADLSSPSEVRRAFQWIEEKLGGVSIVVNNAAVLVQSLTQDIDEADAEKIITTNVTAVMLCAKEGVNSMKKHGIKDGHIVNINSVAGHFYIHHPDIAGSITAYSTTKHAITALTRGLRFDVSKIPGFKIRVTSVSPGAVSTDMLPEEYRNSLPDPDMVLKTADVSNAVQYALSCPAGVEITELMIQPTGEAF